MASAETDYTVAYFKTGTGYIDPGGNLLTATFSALNNAIVQTATDGRLVMVGGTAVVSIGNSAITANGLTTPYFCFATPMTTASNNVTGIGALAHISGAFVHIRIVQGTNIVGTSVTCSWIAYGI